MTASLSRLTWARRVGWLMVIAAMSLTCRAALAEPDADARQAIEASYHKASEAMALKFIDGIRSIRTPGFRSFAPDGQLNDTKREDAAYHDLLAPAISAQDKTEILEFKRVDAIRIICKVHEVVEIVSPIGPKQAEKLILDTHSQDGWLRTPSGWKLDWTYIQTRTTEHQPVSQ